MTSPSTTAAPTAAWKLTGLAASDGRGRIDLAVPAAGVAVAGDDRVDDRTEDRVLGVDLRSPAAAARLVDHWARGDDVVGVYEPADPRRLRATAMWRSLPVGNAWELVVSAQTALVESDSAVAVTCDLAQGALAWGRGSETGVLWHPLERDGCPAEATCLLVRRSTDAVLIAVHPADVRRILVASDGGRVRVTCWLFTAAIEKGVLLKSRVLAAVGPATDTAWAEALIGGLAAAPPPLSA
jgi:hypothetical protein